MPTKKSANWMLSEAVDAIARAERMHRQFFQLQTTTSSSGPAWEPPVDVIETARELLIFVALPGVDLDTVEAAVEDGVMIVVGRRTLPPELRNAVIHRLELPQGRFERRIALPAGRYTVRRFASNGCLVLTLAKAA